MTLLPSSEMKLRNQVCWIAWTASFFAHSFTASGSFTVKLVLAMWPPKSLMCGLCRGVSLTTRCRMAYDGRLTVGVLDAALAEKRKAALRPLLGWTTRSSLGKFFQK